MTRDIGYRASMPVEEGVKRFVEWYRSYYHPQTASSPSKEMPEFSSVTPVLKNLQRQPYGFR